MCTDYFHKMYHISVESSIRCHFKIVKPVFQDTLIEEVRANYTLRRVVNLLRVFEQDTRLQAGPVLLADPGEFEFGFLVSDIVHNLEGYPVLRFVGSEHPFENFDLSKGNIITLNGTLQK